MLVVCVVWCWCCVLRVVSDVSELQAEVSRLQAEVRLLKSEQASKGSVLVSSKKSDSQWDLTKDGQQHTQHTSQ